MIQYRTLDEEKIDRALFRDFVRRQAVTKCWRKEDGWIVKDVLFVDDCTKQNHGILIEFLKNTICAGGFVYGAFCGGTSSVLQKNGLRGSESVSSKAYRRRSI